MKTIARFVGVAMVLGLVAGAVAPAQAQTVADLQKMIADLQAQLSGLSGSTSSTTSVTFTRDLTVGSRGADVTALQNILISKGHLAAGLNSGYFGALTKAAVIKWQTAAGISPAAGYVGPKSRAALSTSSSTSTGTSTSGSTTSGDLKGGDGDFGKFNVLSTPDNKKVEEAQTEKVLGFEVKAQDSDLKIERVNLVFSSTSRPWNGIQDVVLYAGDKKVATLSADSKSDWDQDGNDYSIKFNGLDAIVKEDQTVRFYVGVVAKDTIDSKYQGAWTVALDGSQAVRAVNAEGINVYEGSSETRSFRLADISNSDVSISVDDNENDDATVEVDDQDTTDNVTLYTSTFENNDSDKSVDITEVAVDLATTTGTANNLSNMIETLYLYIDGKEVASESVANAATTTVTFSDFDAVTVDGDDNVSIVVKADIAGSDDYTSGDGVTVSGITTKYENANGDEDTVTGANGGDISFATNSIQVSSLTADAAIAPLSNNEAQGRFFVNFKVSAPKNDDIYIANSATTTTAVGSGAGVSFKVVGSNGSLQSATTTSVNDVVTKISGGSTVGNYYKISRGTTATLQLDVVVDNTGAASARTLGVALVGVNYKINSAATADQKYTNGLDKEEFRSKTAYLLTSNTTN